MKNKKSALKNAGLSLLEILVSMVIFALIMGGLVNLFVATKRQVVHAHSRIAAAELARSFLDRLQMDVRQDTWDQPVPNNLLTPGNYKSSNYPFSKYASYASITAGSRGFEEPLINNITYYPVYEITSWHGLRRVKLIISWQEPSS